MASGSGALQTTVTLITSAWRKSTQVTFQHRLRRSVVSIKMGLTIPGTNWIGQRRKLT